MERVNHLGHNRNIRCNPLCRFNGQKQLVQVGKGFENEQIHPAFQQSGHLFNKGLLHCAGFNLTTLKWKIYASRTDGSGHKDIMPCCPACQLSPLQVNFPNPVFSADPEHFETIGPKCIGLNEFASGPNVFLMNGIDQVRIADVKQISILCEVYTFFKEIGPKGAISQHDFLVKVLYEVMFHRSACVSITHETGGFSCLPVSLSTPPVPFL